jgi:hypothetical protein
VNEHVPPEQVPKAWAGAHTRPHPPQFAGSIIVLMPSSITPLQSSSKPLQRSTVPGAQPSGRSGPASPGASTSSASGRLASVSVPPSVPESIPDASSTQSKQ